MLILDNVSLKKGLFRLKEISFSLSEGEYLTMVGPTGSGKTMMLDTVIGINRPQTGEIRVKGRSMSRVPLQNRPVGIVYQNLYLFPHKNVYDNIAFPLAIKKMPKKTIRKKVEETAAFLKITDILGRSIQNLSGGEKQRVALARALVPERPVLLLDEPLSALDAITKWEIMQELRRIHREKRLTVLHVTHDIESALLLDGKDKLSASLIKSNTTGSPRLRDRPAAVPSRIWVTAFSMPAPGAWSPRSTKSSMTRPPTLPSVSTNRF